ncbi:MAG: hypothetical protein IT208_08415 [Chthonomonadales bacterium]|nr:hypothetical protein [Chthonomonadales bacterium]
MARAAAGEGGGARAGPASGASGAQGAGATGGAPTITECQTCKERRYQDRSEDPGVSFKAATHVSREAAAAAVTAHESEHVRREQRRTREEGREIAYQTVRIFMAACPECGRTYVAGGLTRTVTRAASGSRTEPQHPLNVDIRA